MMLFFYGPNTFASRQKLQELIERFQKSTSSQFGLERFDGAQATPEQVVAAITSLPFLAANRLIIIYDMLANKLLGEAVLKAQSRIPESTVAVVYESEPDERTKIFKTLKTFAKTIKFEQPTSVQLKKWLQQYSASLGGTIDALSIDFLIDRAGQDQWRLSQELNKLINLDAQVSIENIKALVEPVFEKNIFDLVEALAKGEVALALTLYSGLRAQRAEPLYILNMIGWQLRNLLVVKAGEGRSFAQIAKEAGMSPFVVRKSQAIAAGMDLKTIKSAYQLIQQADWRFKTSAVDADLLLEGLILAIARLL